MKEKMHITILSIGVCALMGLTFAISSRDYKEKEIKLNSAPESTMISKKFECTKVAISETSSATKEYKKNLDKWHLLYDEIETLNGGTITNIDPCDGLKGKKRTECNINNIELRGILHQIKKIEEKLAPYEECQKSLGITKESGQVVSKEVETTKKSKKKEEKTTTKEKNITPKTKWSEGEWSTCSNAKQTRTVTCQLNGKKVDDKRCEGKKPSVSKVCKSPESSINSGKDTSTSICTNSDGKDYYTKGSAKDQSTINNIPGGVMYDSCAIGGDNGSNMQYQYIQSCVSRNCYIHEFYCSEYGNVSVEPYRCPNGCTDGACNKNPVGSCTNLLVAELNSFNRTVPIKCEGDDVKYSDIVVEYPDGTLFDTFPGLNVTVTLPNSPKGNYIVKCYVNGQTTTTSSCQKIITN